MSIQQTVIHFPELYLASDEIQFLRGYFGNKFKEHSLMHNHYTEGEAKNFRNELRYAYPLIQYKIIANKPYLVGFLAGAEVLIQIFKEIKEIEIARKISVINEKKISVLLPEITHGGLYEYEFVTPYTPFNQKNYEQYKQISETKKQELVHRLLVNHIVAVLNAFGIKLDAQKEKILVLPKLNSTVAKCKTIYAAGFRGSFVTNVHLPDLIGLGRWVSVGFGTVKRSGC
jgi:hypothetical protein